MVDYPEQIGVKPDTSDMAYDIAMSKIRGLNKNLAGLDLEANPFMPHTGLEQPLIGGAGLPIAVKTAQAVNKDAGYDTTQNGAFYRISPKNYSTNRSTFTKNGNEVWPASPIDANGTGPVRYGDTAYDKTTYKPYKVMPSDEQNVPLQIASDYVKSRGLPAISQPKMAPSSLDKQGAIGATYDLATQGSPEYKQAIFNAYSKTMPDVIKKSGATNYDELLEAAYGQMAKETADQFNALPLRYSFHRNGEGNYLDSSNMLHDLHDNGHLFVFQGGDPHDFLHNVDPKTGLNENEKFRAVHDAIGHGIYGNTFKPEGEERAWGVHSQMYSPLAQLAMTAETRGQNSFVNYTPVNADLKEKIYKIKGNAISGYGMYAKWDLPKGSILFQGEEKAQRIVTKKFVDENWDEREKLNFRRYAYPIGKDVYILWDLQPEEWSPQNHHCDANCSYVGLNVIVNRDIKKGEELTLDYGSFLDETMEPFNCNCGASNCRGLIKGIAGNKI